MSLLINAGTASSKSERERQRDGGNCIPAAKSYQTSSRKAPLPSVSLSLSVCVTVPPPTPPPHPPLPCPPLPRLLHCLRWLSTLALLRLWRWLRTSALSRSLDARLEMWLCERRWLAPVKTAVNVRKDGVYVLLFVRRWLRQSTILKRARRLTSAVASICLPEYFSLFYVL